MRSLLTAALTLTLLVAARAAEPDPRDWRRVDPGRRVDLPCDNLRLRDDLRLTEGPRSLRDAFPYLAVAPKAVSSTNATVLTPRNLGSFLVMAPQEGGTVPAAIRTGAEAIEAVRLFVAGPLVTSIDTGDRLLAAALALEEDLEAVSVHVTAHRPETWLPLATPLDQDKSQHPVEAWAVSLVALEVDRKLRLVHVKARVRADGEVEIAREAIVDGPWTTWQSEGEMTDEARRRDAQAHAEVDVVRARFAHAFRLAADTDLDTVWAVARADPRMQAARLWLGEPDREWGSGLRIHDYELADGGVARFGTAADLLVYVRWDAGSAAPVEATRPSRTLYACPTR